MKVIEKFDMEIMTAIKERHKLMGFSHLTPEKVTQVIGNNYKETLESIEFGEYPDEIKIVLFITIAFYVFSDNVILNVGLKGLKLFIEDL